MRVLNRTEFLKLPKGTIYSKGKKWYFTELLIKQDTIIGDVSFIGDWFYFDTSNPKTNHIFDTWEESLTKGTSFESGSILRDGCFDEDDLFLIYEKEDLEELMAYVDEALLNEQ